MKTAAQRAEKRRARESRPVKVGTWKCSGCGERHPHNERCPIQPRPMPAPIGGLEFGVLAALAALNKGGRR